MGIPSTLAEADQLREWALTTVPAAAAAASADQLARHLEFMAAALPSRANDAETGRKRVAVYASILAGKSNEALAFMSRRACETLEWFPSPKQCLDILADYRPPETPQAAALLTCERFTEQAFAEWMRALRDGAPVGDVPERWKRIAVEQGDARRLDDGSYTSRRLYYGPPRPPYRPPPREVAPARPSTPTPPAATHGQPGATEGLVP